ncbi:MAG TPA: DnaJ domain-containing protein [Xanthobacteraceae bacterium]|nr:DnaJ domain-containing protein [Xanthobacteraceae bacterium]
MTPLLIGVAVLLFVIGAMRLIAHADARLLARNLRRGSGVAALAGAAYLTAIGRFPVAIPLGIFGLGLLDLLPSMASFGGRTRPSPGQTSKVRSRAIEMELDHDSGEMRGAFISGKYAGVALDALDQAALVSVLPDLDEESRALLEAYLDRRAPGWREHVEEDAGAGPRQPPRHGPMTEEEAYKILGVEKGASAVEIRRAHRSLMKKLHPDQGGSTYLAARVNEAKEILLRSHR